MSRDQRVLIDFIDEGNDEFFNYLGESTFLLSLFMDAILLRMTAFILVHHILTIVDRGFIVVNRLQSTGWTEFMQKDYDTQGQVHLTNLNKQRKIHFDAT